MKNLIYFGLILISFWACGTSKSIVVKESVASQTKQSDTIKIANKELEYEIIIIDPGFNYWLNSQARPPRFFRRSRDW